MEQTRRRHAHDFIAGAVAGSTCKMFEFPFDTVKVLQQTQLSSSKGISAWNCLRGVIKTNGVKGLYSGLATPLLSCTFETALLFYVYEKSKSFLSPPQIGSTSLSTAAISGAIAGACTPALVTPVEFVKCNLQVQAGSKNPKFAGPLDCVVKTLKAHGVRGIYKGFFATVLRESPGSSLWFVSYELSNKIMLKPGQSKEDLPLWKLTASGSISGVLYWLAFFPADVIKSQLQTESAGREKFWSVFSKIRKTDGLPGLYRGLSVTLIRAVPSNGFLFLAYEVCKRLLNEVSPS